MNKILTASYEDKQEILELYRTMLYGPADWNEYYPNEDTIEFDLSRNALYVMKNDEGQIISAISIDEDEAVDSLDCWDRALFPGAEISRLCVRKDMQHQGIAKQMMRYVFEVLKKQRKKSVHILVKTGHTAAMSSYGAIGFKTVGNCRLLIRTLSAWRKIWTIMTTNEAAYENCNDTRSEPQGEHMEHGTYPIGQYLL